MKQLIFIFFTIGLLGSSFAQEINDYKYDFNWITGQDSTYEPENNKTDDCMRFDFNGDTLTISKESGLANFLSTSASISDKKGNLLFFTNGCHVFNKDYKIMENGEYINNPVVLDNYCDSIYNTGYWVPQGALILPRTDTDSIYDLLTLEFVYTGLDLQMKYLHHSIININKNDGLGIITEKNNVILNDSLGGLLTAVKTADASGWWIITKREKSNEYIILQFDNFGYKGKITQNIGPYDKYNDITGNGVAFSPDGKKYAHYEPRQGLFLYKFDRVNGLLSDFKLINVVGNQKDTLQSGFICFSPNSRFIYIANGQKLWQIDTELDNPESGIELVAETNFIPNPGTVFYTTFGSPTLAPDCKIYIGMFGTQPWFTVINNPNFKGSNCNVISAKTKLPMKQWPAFPNMINYRLGTDQPVCDSTKIVLTAHNFIIRPNLGSLNVYPNPGNDICTITGFGSKKGTIVIMNIQGEIVLKEEIRNGITIKQIDTSDLMPGFYIVHFKASDQSVTSCKWIKI